MADIPKGWDQQMVNFLTKALYTEIPILVQHLETPLHWTTRMGIEAAHFISAVWDTACILYGVPDGRETLTAAMFSDTSPMSIIGFSQLAQTLQADCITEAPYAELVVILEADPNMSIEYVDCITAVSQKLSRVAETAEFSSQGKLRLLTVATEPFDSRLQRLLAKDMSELQFAWPYENTLRLQHTGEHIVKDGPLHGLLRHPKQMNCYPPLVIYNDRRVMANEDRSEVKDEEDNMDWSISIARQIERSPKSLHLVVCFEPWGAVDNLLSDPNLMDPMTTSIDCHVYESNHESYIHDSRLGNPFKNWLQSVVGDRSAHQGMTHVYVIFMAAGVVPPKQIIDLAGLEGEQDPWNLVLVLGRYHMATKYDQLTGQAIIGQAHIGTIEQWDQLSWLAAAPGEAIVIDRFKWASEAAHTWREMMTRNPKSLNLDNAQRRRMGRSHVEGERIADLLVLLAAKSRQGGADFGLTIESLVRDCRSWRQVAAVLSYQGILVSDTKATGAELGKSSRARVPYIADPSIEWHELFLFTRYDYRLAHLMSQKSGDAMVESAKALLVLAMTVGNRIKSLIEIDEDTPLHSFAGKTSGVASSLARFGTWWLKLAVWHNMLTTSPEMKASMIGLPLQVEMTMELDDGRICTGPTDLVAVVKNAARRLVNAIHSPSIEVLPLRQDTLNPESENILHRHILSAFLPNLAVCRQTRDCDGNIAFKMEKVRGRLAVEVRPTYLRDMIHLLLQKEPGPESIIFGIIPDVLVESKVDKKKEYSVYEWIWIPTNVVLEWHQENHRGDEFLAGLWRIEI